MKKTVFSSMLAAAAIAFAAVSCSDAGGTGSLNVAARVPRAALSVGTAGSSDFTMTLTMTGAGDGQPRTAQSLAVTDDSVTFAPVVYDELPVGATVEISAELKSGGTLVAKGTSGKTTIDKGENSATIKISDVREWLVLWNKSNSESSSSGSTERAKGLQVFSSGELKSGLSVTNPLTNNVSDFRIDDDGNIYVLSGQTITRYSHTRTGGYKENGSVNYGTLGLKAEGADVTSIEDMQVRNGTLWLLSQNCNCSADGTPVFKTFLHPIDFDKKTVGTTVGIENIQGEKFAVSDKYFYVVPSYGSTVYKCSLDGTATKQSADLKSNEAARFSLSQLHYQDGALWALCYEAASNQSSKGCVYKIDPDTLSPGKKIGWTDGTIEKNGIDLFAPRRVIAQRPKKLIIADDGVYYEGGYENTNRVVEIDLEAEIITSITPVDVMFDAQVNSSGLTTN